jgi:hypothetical protein
MRAGHVLKSVPPILAALNSDAEPVRRHGFCETPSLLAAPSPWAFCFFFSLETRKVTMMNQAEAADARQHVLILEYMSTNVLRHAEKQAKKMRDRAESLKKSLQLEAPEGHKVITQADQEVFMTEQRKRKQQKRNH